MSLFRYSGLTTKVRAMSGALLSKEDFDQISTLGNVPEVVAWLKKKPSYGKVLGNENENTMHRGQAEGRIKRSFYADFSKLYRFSNMEQRNFLDTYFRRYEITCLKNIVQAILSDSPTILRCGLLKQAVFQFLCLILFVQHLTAPPLMFSPLSLSLISAAFF